MEQSIASVLAQHNLQESLLILKDCQARGFDTFCMLRSFQCINVIQCVVWVEPKKFNLVIWDFGSSGSDSCFFLFPMNYFPLSFLLSLTPFFSWSFWLQAKVLVWLSFPLLNGGRVRTALQCSDARHASGTTVAETIRRVCGEASICPSLEKTVPWLI